MDIDHDWENYTEDSVRNALFARKDAGINWEQKNKNDYESINNFNKQKNKDEFNNDDKKIDE